MELGTISNSTNSVTDGVMEKETKQVTETKKSRVYGKTIGQPKLSEQGKEYFEKLQAKYKNMDFILVSGDKKDKVREQAGQFANPLQMVVLIDDEKIERMANDAEFRKQYEALIENAQKKLPKLSKIMKAFPNVMGFGVEMTGNGSCSFFAFVKKDSDSQTKYLEKIKAAKKEEQKKEKKRAERKEAQNHLEKLRSESKNKQKLEEKKEVSRKEKEEYLVLKADSMEEMERLLENYFLEERTNLVKTESEKYLGTVIDFKG